MCRETPNAADDARLMGLLGEGDRSALADLVKRHQLRVVELAYRTTGDRALADDIAQEAFLRVWRAAGRYKPSARFSTWLHRIVVNLCLDAFKKRSPKTGEAPQTWESAHDEGEDCARQDLVEQVRRSVADLPARQRMALVLHRFSGHSIRSVAEVTGWSESSVESLLVRAYANLRRSLGEK